MTNLKNPDNQMVMEGKEMDLLHSLLKVSYVHDSA